MSAAVYAATLGATEDFHGVYRSILWRLLSGHAFEEVNERTGAKIFASRVPIHFNLDLREERLPMCGVRRVYPQTAAAEVAWFLRGDRDVDFIRQYAPIWDKFVEDDGHTVAGAYGYRWREHFDRDQLGDAIAALRANRTDRRIVVMAWDPASDGLGRPSKNVPCPLGFTLSVVDGLLNSTIVLRSSDVFVGLPYDVMGHALLMKAVATSLQLRGLGVMAVTLAHPHLYGVHEEMAMAALRAVPSDDSRPMPAWAVEQIEQDPHGYVRAMREAYLGIERPEYSCRPEVVA